MKLIDRPNSVPIAWGTDAGIGYINPIPPTSQIGINPGYASWPDGFVPLNFEDPSTGGVPPRGADMNGVLNEISAGLRWIQAGGFPVYNGTFSTSIGGYPYGAVVASLVYKGLLWTSLVDDNTADPDAFGAYWAPFNRWRLTADQTIYVNGSTGNDNNSGLTVGEPVQTIARANFLISTFIDPAGWDLTVNIAAGTYTNDPILVDNSSISNVIYEASSGPVYLTINSLAHLAAVGVTSGGRLTLRGNDFHISVQNGSPVSQGIGVTQGGGLTVDGNINFGANDNANYFVVGGFIFYTSGRTDSILDDSPRHWLVGVGGTINTNGAHVNLVGTRDFSSAFVDSPNLGSISVFDFVFSGSATGRRWNVEYNGTIKGVPPSPGPDVYFPGDINGTQAFGGQIGL